MKDEQNIIAAIFFMALVGLFSTTAQAAPPANNNFANAQILSGASGQATVVNNSEATKEAGEPAHALNRGGHSVWYKYIATGNGVLTLSTSPNFNTTLAVYQGTNMSNLKLLAANDDIRSESSFNIASSVVIGTQNGAVYYIAVDGQFNDATGQTATGNVELTYQFNNAPINDNFASIGSSYLLPWNPQTRVISFTNVGASKEIGEPNHAGNQGGKSVWLRWKNPLSITRSVTFLLEGRSVADSNEGVDVLFAVYKGTSIDSLTEITRTVLLPHLTGNLTFVAEPNTTYYIAVDGYDSGSGAQTGNFMLTYGMNKSQKVADFDFDNKADITVYRPTTGVWYTLNSVTGTLRAIQWGANGDKPMTCKVDYDNQSDYVVYRPDTQIWYTNISVNFGSLTQKWGLNTDIPMTLSKSTPHYNICHNTVFRPTDGTWWIRSGIPVSFQFGQPGDVPMTADFNGDGTDEVAVFRPSNGTFYIGNSSTGELIDEVQFGQNGDIPVPADFDADGFADIAIYRPSTGTWWFRDKNTGAQTAMQFGLAGDKPQPADYDGDGKADLAVYRNGVWWIRQSSNGAVRTIQFGLSSDIPVTSPAN